MASRFGNRTYGRPSKVCQSNIQFEKVFMNEKSNNRPSAAKSTGVLHKWGKTSFTSTRNSQLNGQKERSTKPDDSSKRARMDFDDDPFSFDTDGGEPPRVAPTKLVSSMSVPSMVEQPTKKVQTTTRRPNKFFKSGNRASLSALHNTILPFCKGSKNTPLSAPAETLNDQKVDEFCNSDLELFTNSGDGNHDDDLGKELSQDFCAAAVGVNIESEYSDDSQPIKQEEENDDCLLTAKTKQNRFSKSYSSSKSQGVNKRSARLVTTTTTTLEEIEKVDSQRETANNTDDLWSALLSATETVPESATGTSAQSVIELSESNASQTTSDQFDHCATVESLSNEDKMFDDEEDNVELEISFLSEVVSPVKNVSPFNSVDLDLMEGCEDEIGESQTNLVTPMESSQETVLLESQVSSSQSCSQPVLRTRRIFNSPKKFDKKALYKHRPWHVEEEPQENEENKSVQQTSLADEFDEEDIPTARLVRVTTWPTKVGEEAVTSVRCSKKVKELYKVVRNVKQAHQCHESGETQEFNDDIEYLLGGLQDTIPVSTRCLSILSLASKCMAPGFRMHLRAQGTISKIFSALHDAPTDLNLSLCTATVMFVLSQDRLTMDLEKGSLELMLQLLESDSKSAVHSVMTTKVTSDKDLRELDRNRSKVRELCEEVQRKGKGHAQHLNLDNITVGHLAMETLLSLTSRRAGEWFKEELRELGGLDHIVDTVADCTRCLGRDLKNATDSKMDKLSKIDRCLRVLESVTMMNAGNQLYLIDYKDSVLIISIVNVFRLCISALPSQATLDKCEKESPGSILLSCILSVLKVLLNLTNDNSEGSGKIGEQEGVLDICLHCILHISKVIPTDQVFDLLVLMLGLLINLMEHCTLNRRRLFKTEVFVDTSSDVQVPAIKVLVDLFHEREEMARQEEMRTDRLLDGKGDRDSENEDNDGGTSSQNIQDIIEVTITKALQKAGRHMEDSMIAAYVTLLLGCFIEDNEEYTRRVRDHLPERSFQNMVQVLQKFFNFVTLTSTVGNTGIKSIQRVIEILKSS